MSLIIKVIKLFKNMKLIVKMDDLLLEILKTIPN